MSHTDRQLVLAPTGVVGAAAQPVAVPVAAEQPWRPPAATVHLQPQLANAAQPSHPTCLPLPAAVLCFMVGPLGLLCHLVTKAAVLRWRGRGGSEEYVVYRF